MSNENLNESCARIEDERGQVIIKDDVIAAIAGLSAMEIEGVASMNGNVTKEMLGKLGIKNASKGVSIELQENAVAIKLSLSLRYGYSIPKTSKEVQEKVKTMIEETTGLTVSSIDVRIAGIELDKA